MNKVETQHIERDAEKIVICYAEKHASGSDSDSTLSHTGFWSNAAEGLSHAHRDYLLRRHGTLDLDPIPDMSDADPYNWPMWKVRPSGYVFLDLY